MASSSDLEDFRNNWKNELKKQKSQNTLKESGRSCSVTDTDKSDSDSGKVNESGLNTSISEPTAGCNSSSGNLTGERQILQAFVDDQKIDNIRKRKNTLQPFLIAEDLLSGNPSTSCCKKLKNEAVDLVSSKDIIADKKLEDHCFLDIFLNDLVCFIFQSVYSDTHCQQGLLLYGYNGLQIVCHLRHQIVIQATSSDKKIFGKILGLGIRPLDLYLNSLIK